MSVHGANRLGTNSLLDLIVFGRATGNHIVNSHPERQHAHQPEPQQAVEFSMDRVNKLESRTSGEKTQDIGNAIRFSMQRHCGVFRTLELLNEGVTQIEDPQASRQHLLQATSPRCSTPRASRRWNWPT